MEEDNFRGRFATRSMSMAIDAPLADVNSILNEFNQNSLDAQSLRLLAEIKRILDFQKESIQEIVEKAQAMISDII